jgi:serine protease Do
MYLAILYVPGFGEKTITNVTKTEKEVTVTDNGIADAVEKVYDSVVIVETFAKGRAFATGTGFIYKHSNDTYYILTNHHVIEDGDQIKIVLTNGDEVEVKVEGGDEFSDIAVLSYKTDKELKVSNIGSSTNARVGDTVFAIGAPLDSSVYSWTVTRGVLSGKDREVSISLGGSQTSDWIMQVLQTDAAINSGNSGGPLCNSNGEVIGITNMKLSSSAIEGMGFAIPIDTAIGYADKFIKGENIDRPYLGVNVTDNMSYGWFTIKTGVYIQSVEKSSPADKAGLIAGDKILEVNGAEVSDTTHFKYELYKYKIGETIEIKYERNGVSQKTKVTLGSNGKSA